MSDQTIVAVYDTPAHAESAVQELVQAGIVSSAIERHASTASTGVSAPKEEPGFWSSLFGGDTDTYDRDVTHRSLQAGSTVVTVKVGDTDVERVSAILDRHNPIDVDERGTNYGLSRNGAVAGAMPVSTDSAVGDMSAARTGGVQTGMAHGADTGAEEVLRLKEEQLAIGKRLVNKGTTRVRRFVVETPVTETVSLHSERAFVERRPATGAALGTADGDFTERTIEVNESDEEAVVSKTARVREEVVIRKDSTDRTETVTDTVRREDVEVTRDGDRMTGVTGTPMVKPVPAE